MTATNPNAHIEASEHSTEEVDEGRGAGSPAIKPNKDLGEDGKPVTDTQDNQSI